MKKLRLLVLATYPMVSCAAINLDEISEQWTTADPPEALVAGMNAVGMTCERYFIDPESQATLAFMTRPPSRIYTVAEHNGTIEGLRKGYANGAAKSGEKAIRNELVRYAGVELVHQELRRDGFICCTITQVSDKGLEQIIAVIPERSYDSMILKFYGLFSPVTPPSPSASSSAFEEASESGTLLGQAFTLVVLVLLGGGGTAVGIYLWRKRAKPPPSPEQQ